MATSLRISKSAVSSSDLNPVNLPTESKVKYWRINIWVYVQVIGETRISYPPGIDMVWHEFKLYMRIPTRNHDPRLVAAS